MSLISDMESSREEQIIILPFVIPLPIFKVLQEAAIKEQKSVEQFVTETLRKKVKEIGVKTNL